MAFYDNSHQTYEREIERCAICQELSRQCIRDEGLKALGTGLMDEHSEENATNQALASSALKRIERLSKCKVVGVA